MDDEQPHRVASGGGRSRISTEELPRLVDEHTIHSCRLVALAALRR